MICEDHDRQVVSKNMVAELLIRVLCGSQPDIPADGIYHYCQTESNQESVFQTALSLLCTSIIIFCRRILLRNFGEYCPLLPEKVVVTLVQCQLLVEHRPLNSGNTIPALLRSDYRSVFPAKIY
jgi:hypothetical protein